MDDNQLDFTELDQSEQYNANPRKYPFLSSLKISEDVIRRLSIHLDRIVVGSDESFMSPIGKDIGSEVILNMWDSIYSSNSNKINETLNELEQSNRSKYGPRSIAKSWKLRKQSLENYYSTNSNTSAPGFKSIHQGNLRPLDFSAAMNKLKNNTNSGLPYYTRKSRVKEKTLERILEQLSQNYPCILFTRTQEGDKTRNVWGYPCADTLNEMRYYAPLLARQKRLDWRAALLGPDAVDRSISEIIFKAKIFGLFLLSIDFSSYDATVKSPLIGRSFEYIGSCFQHAYRDEISQIGIRFNTIPIITPDGIMTGPHGVPSGATFTNEVDSIVQYLIASECGVDDSLMQIQGDDGAYAIPESNHERLVSSFKRYGLNFNEEKSYYSKDFLVYLQKLYHIDYASNNLIGGIYSTYRALGRIVFQERYSNFEDFELSGKDYYSIRAITILENCKYHPLFNELVELVYRLDKYKLQFNQSAVKDYANMISNGSGTGGLLINQYGDNVSGIYAFETIKVLRKIGWVG